MDWIDLPQDWAWWLALVNVLMNSEFFDRLSHCMRLKELVNRIMFFRWDLSDYVKREQQNDSLSSEE